MKLFRKSAPMNLFQYHQFRLSVKDHYSKEFLSVVVYGYSDTGDGGMRSASQMKLIREMLLKWRLRFSAFSLVGLSDEVLSLYSYGFSQGLSQKTIRAGISHYQTEIGYCRIFLPDMDRSQYKRKILRAYESARSVMIHHACQAA